MQIDLPATTIELANSLTTPEKDAAAVIAEALARVAWERQEVAAVKEGIAAYEAGDHEPLEAFDARFRAEHGMAPKS